MKKQTTKLFGLSSKCGYLVSTVVAFALCCTSANSKSETKRKNPLMETSSVSTQDLRFGEQQLQKMLIDRPELNKVIFKQDPVWRWAIRQFAGEGAKARIYWNSGDLSCKSFEYDAEHNYPLPTQQGCIRLRKTSQFGTPVLGEKLLSGFVFECYNIRNGPAFEKTNKAALTGAITKEQFIEQNTKIEYEAVSKTAKFYKEVYLPLATKRQSKTDAYLWGTYEPTKYADWRARFKDRTRYPWSYMEKYYDSLIKPYQPSKPSVF